MSIWKQWQAVSAGAASLFGRSVITDRADLFGDDLETITSEYL